MNSLFNFIEGFFKTENGNLNVLGKVISIFIVFLAIKIFIKTLNKVIDKTVNHKKKSTLSGNERKLDTLTAVVKNITKYIIYFIGVIIILDDIFGINTTSILATAGIGGLAISFGAQSLVKDIITGFFILFEDQFSVGDYITIGDYSGTVEELGVRITKLRDFSGELHIIPNGNITTVTNIGRGPMRSSVDIAVAYEEDIDRAIKVIEQVCNKIKEGNDNIVEGPTVLGVTELGDSGISITVVAKTNPMEQWALERELKKAIKEAFDRENIEIPYPKMVVYNNKS